MGEKMKSSHKTINKSLRALANLKLDLILADDAFRKLFENTSNEYMASLSVIIGECGQLIDDINDIEELLVGELNVACK